MGKTWCPSYRRLDGPQDRSAQVWELAPPPLGFNSITAQPVASCYTDYDVQTHEVANLHPNFNYVLTFEMTCNSYEGRKHNTVNSELSGHNGT